MNVSAYYVETTTNILKHCNILQWDIAILIHFYFHVNNLFTISMKYVYTMVVNR